MRSLTDIPKSAVVALQLPTASARTLRRLERSARAAIGIPMNE